MIKDNKTKYYTDISNYTPEKMCNKNGLTKLNFQPTVSDKLDVSELTKQLTNMYDIKIDYKTNKPNKLWYRLGPYLINDDEQLKSTIQLLTSKYSNYIANKVLDNIKNYCYINTGHSLPAIDPYASNDITIPFINGVLDINDLNNIVFRPYKENEVFTNIIQTEYNPNAKSKTLDKFMDDIATDTKAGIVDKDIEQLLYQAIGSSMLNDNLFQTQFILRDPLNNYSKILINLINQMLNGNNSKIQNTYYTTMNKAFFSRFDRINMLNKLAIFIETPKDSIKKYPDGFKPVTSGDTCTIDERYYGCFNAQINGTMFFYTDGPLNFHDNSYALTRRLLVIPFLNKTSISINDTYNLTTDAAMEQLAYKSINAFITMLKNHKDYATSKNIKEYNDEFANDQTMP